MFLRDVEEDEEMRQGIDLYRANQRQQQQQQRQSNKTERMEGVETDPGAAGARVEQEGDLEDEEEDDEGLEIPMDQLQEDFEDMGIGGE